MTITKKIANKKSNHIITYDDNNNEISRIYECKCGKQYTKNPALSLHQKKCNVFGNVPVENVKTNEKDETDTESIYSNLTTNSIHHLEMENLKLKHELELLRIQKDSEITLLKKEIELMNFKLSFLEQQKKQPENIVLPIQPIQPIQQIKNKFNLETFLYEDCQFSNENKDFNELLNTIKMPTWKKEFFNCIERVGVDNYIMEHIDKCIDDECDKNSVYLRPIHCVNKRQKIFQVREKDCWKQMDEKAIRNTISNIVNKFINIPFSVKKEYEEIYNDKKDEYYSKINEGEEAFLEDEDTFINKNFCSIEENMTICLFAGQQRAYVNTIMDYLTDKFVIPKLI